ncbi:hypothetical protein [Xenorhabdus bharatensis]|uniref:hypothetical protein n=1 Tax=Xenorhabdus bharatensis TaxID=3136256 RepID=UPI0030F393DF
MPKHIHADLISEYARLSHITDRPWEYFEVDRNNEIGWRPCSSDIGFNPGFKYRLKPRTIKIGEYDVPEPVRERLSDNDVYYSPTVEQGSGSFSRYTWHGDLFDIRALSNGLIHLDRESAELHAKALISLTQQ